MRVLFVADVPAARPVSGAEQVLFQQAVGLAAAGVEVKILSRQAEDGVTVHQAGPGVEETVYGADPGHSGQFLAALCRHPATLYDRLAGERGFDVIICHQPFTGIALLLGGRIGRLPMLYVFHSPSHEEYLLNSCGQGGLSIRAGSLGRRLVERFCVRRAERVMTLSKYMAAKVRTIHQGEEQRLLVNPGGVDLSRFSPLAHRRIVKKELGLPDGHIHLFTLRNLEPRMGVDNLLRAMALLQQQGMPVHLTLGGDGVERAAMAALIEELGIGARVTMTGFLDDQDLARYYGAADYFVLPTRQLEGFGLVTPESLACGTPVLGTPIGGTLEILSKFDEQFLFNDTAPKAMAEGIMAAVQRFADLQEYENLRQRCRHHAEEHYSWQRHTENLLAVLKEIQG